MEELSFQQDNQENNFLCLICGLSAPENFQLANNNNCDDREREGISKQLNVIFILRNLLQVPNNQLHEFLKNYGNPEDWISLCDNCNQLTREAWALHQQIVQIIGKLKDCQKLIVEKVKSSTDTPSGGGEEEERSKVNQLTSDKDKDTPKLTIWKETRSFVKNYNFEDTLEDPILEANKLIKKLEASPSPKIETDLQDNYDPNFEHLSPGSPSSPTPSSNHQDNPDDSTPLDPFLKSPHKCPQCPLEFLKQKPLLRHLQTFHKMSLLPCYHSGCPHKTTTIQGFFGHRHWHRHTLKKTQQILISGVDPNKLEDNRKYRPQTCPQCKLTFPSISTTFKHMSIVHKIENYPCLHPNCSKTFPKLRNFIKHRQTHLTPFEKKEMNLNRKPKSRRPKVTKPRVICDHCGGSFGNKSGLTSHLKYVHGLGVAGVEEDKKRIYKDATCHICGMVVRAGGLKHHMLRKHKDKLVDEEGPDNQLFQCGVVGCKRWYMKKESLDKHLEDTHGGWDGQGERPIDRKPSFECGICGMGFYFKGRLEIHELGHQGKGKEFICDLCGRGFGTEKHLGNHLKFKACKMVQRRN